MPDYRIKYSLLICCILLMQNLFAQDTAVQAEKHIYDSSANFFNWREELDEPYYVKTSPISAGDQAKITAYKNDKNFWYVNAVEELEDRYIAYAQMSDSMARLNTSEKKENRSLNNKKQQGEVDEEVSVLVNGSNMFTSTTWVTLLLLLLLAFLLFIFFNKDNVLLRTNRKIETLNIDGQPENIFSISYATAIAAAECDGKYARAIRLRYLEMIKLMSESGMLNYQPDLTNMDYLEQLRSSKYLDAFITITRHYEFGWYGKLVVNEVTYKKIREDFIHFKTALA